MIFVDCAEYYCDDGYEEYIKDGMPHRANGPACIWKGNKGVWYKNGRMHRYYGECSYGYDEVRYNIRWYIDGRRVK